MAWSCGSDRFHRSEWHIVEGESGGGARCRLKEILVSVSQPSIDRKAQQEHLAAVCERGIDLCRQGEWNQGLVDLAWLIQGKQAKNLPSLCYSYLGYGLAKTQRKVDQGRKLCRHAIRREWFQPENYVNLARTCLLSEKYRQEAWEAVRDGLKVDPDQPELRALRDQLGNRRPPVLTFLSRRNLLNRILGSFRHHLTTPLRPSAKKPDQSPSRTAQGSVVVS